MKTPPLFTKKKFTKKNFFVNSEIFFAKALIQKSKKKKHTSRDLKKENTE